MKIKRFLKVIMQIIIITAIYDFIKGFIDGWKESASEDNE